MSQLLTTRTSMEELFGILLLNLLDKNVTWIAVQLKLNKFNSEKRALVLNHEHEVNLQKKFPGEAIS